MQTLVAPDNVTSVTVGGLVYYVNCGTVSIPDEYVTELLDAGYLKQFPSSLQINNGPVSLPTITDHGNGSVSIDGTGLVNFFKTPTYQYAIVEQLIVPATPIPLVLTNDAINYIYAYYNNGNPYYAVTMNPLLYLTDYRYVAMFRAYRYENVIRLLDYDEYGFALQAKLYYKDIVKNGIERESGIELLTEATRQSTVKSGIAWFGTKRLVLDENKAGVSGSLYHWSKTDGVWGQSLVTQYDSSTYSNGSNEVALDNNKWVSKYFFRCSCSNTVHYYSGSEHNTQQSSSNESVPSAPSPILATCTYVGKIVIQKDATNGTAYSRVWGSLVTGAPNVTKDDIGLGNVENTALSTWTGSTNITTLGTITTGSFGTVSNHSSFESDGTLVFTGDATVYDDIFCPTATGKVGGANYPAWSSFTANLNAYTFAVNDYIDIGTVEMPHSWKEGSQIEVHVHWATNGANDATPRGVKWAISYALANIESAGGTIAFSEATLTQSTDTTIAASEPSLTHKYSTVGTITMTGYKIGAGLKMRLKRITASGTAPANNPFVLMVGVHYEMDTCGSRSLGTK